MSPMSAANGTNSAGGVKLTYEDFLLFPDDGKRHELIDGEHFVTASPNTRHQRVVGNLHWLLRNYLETRPRGEVFMAPFDVLFSQFDVVEPDLLYMSHDRAAAILTAQHVTGAPELVVEVGSPSTRKRDDSLKRDLYERFGVSEYWVVDPDHDVVRVYRREATRFMRADALTQESDVLTTPLLPGFAAPLATIFPG